VKLLIATDVAARGLDIPDVEVGTIDHTLVCIQVPCRTTWQPPAIESVHGCVR